MMVRLQLDTDFVVPPGTNELISQHLVTSAEVARRVGVGRATVSNWLTRHPAFAGLAIPLSGSSFAFWWPHVEACLRGLGLPQAPAMRGVQQVQRRPRITCSVCQRDVQRRADGTPRTHYPPPGRSDLVCGDPGRHCRGSHPDGSE